MNRFSLLPVIAGCVVALLVVWSNVAFGQTTPHSTGVPIPPEPGLTGLPPLEVDDSQIRDQKHEKFTELRDRIEQLGELLRKHRSSNPEEGIDDSFAPHDPGSPREKPQDPPESSTPGGTANNSQQASGNETSPQSSESAAERDIDVAPAVDGAIDRVALASSLFASGEYETCVQTIQSIDLSSQRVEVRRWLTYLHAGCLRKLGSSDEAKRFYRKIVTENPESWLGNQSRWWIDQMSEKSELEQSLQALTQSLDQWRLEIDGLLKSN